MWLHLWPAFADFPRHLPALGVCAIRLRHSKPLELFPCLPAIGSLPLFSCFSSYFMESTDLAWLKNDFYVGGNYCYLPLQKAEHKEIGLSHHSWFRWHWKKSLRSPPLNELQRMIEGILSLVGFTTQWVICSEVWGRGTRYVRWLTPKTTVDLIFQCDSN